MGHLFPSNLVLVPYAISLILVLGSCWFRRRAWPWLISSSLFLAGYAYVTDVNPTNQAQADLPVREATVTIEVLRSFESDSTQIRALGEIVSTEPHLSELKGSKIYLALGVPKEAPPEPIPVNGSHIQATGIFSPLDPHDQQGGFHSYLRNSGCAGTFNRGVVLSVIKQPGPWRTILNGLLDSANSTLTHRIDSYSPGARSYRAMLLGLKSELSDQQKSLFLQSGALHLFAISGLHIGVIATCGHALFLLFRVPRLWIPIPNLSLITFFVLMTGGAPSAWRALLMIACYYLCQFSNRQSASINALVLSATICLIINPLQLFLAGFQMSYITVASILLFGVPIGNRLCDHWNPFKDIPRNLWSYRQKSVDFIGRFAVSSFAISLAAFLASGALSIIYFNTLSTVGILVNLILLPLASLAIISGFLALAFSIVGLGTFVSLFNHAAMLILWLMHSALHGFNQFDGTHLTFENPPIPILFALLAALLAYLFFGYNRLWKFRTRWLLLFPVAYTGACIIAASTV